MGEEDGEDEARMPPTSPLPKQVARTAEDGTRRGRLVPSYVFLIEDGSCSEVLKFGGWPFYSEFGMGVRR